ncbi:MAG: GMC family oxidoreductase [Acidobacteria bacterium]|nr:GMC family oxidoreductase [Acidobacteriota bacterium]
MTTQKIYDAVIVGSGAAGGMAAYVLTKAGMDVLVLEAGPKLDLYKDFKTHAWPYEEQYRGRVSPRDAHNYKYGFADGYTSHIYARLDENPYTTPNGKPFDWVRARAVGGRTLVWGRVALRLSEFDFKAASHDGYGDDWPISYADLRPYYDEVDRLIGVMGTNEGLPQLPDGIFQKPQPMLCGEKILQRGVEKTGRRLIPTRAGVISEKLKHNKYRSACHYCGTCGRGCDVGAMFNSPTGLLAPANDTGKLTLRADAVVREVLLDPKTGKVKGVSFVDRTSKKDYEALGKVVILGASTLESTRILLNSKSRIYPTGLANSSGVLGQYLHDHTWGVGFTGLAKNLKGREIINEDGRPQGTYIPAFRNLDQASRQQKYIRRFGYQAGSGAGIFPGHAKTTPGFGTDFKTEVRALHPAFVRMSAFGEVLARKENHVSIDPKVKDAWGIPTLKIDIAYGDNERELTKDAIECAHEMFEAAGIELISENREMYLPGHSIHEVGTARMGNDPRTSVLNKFNQAHDIKNLFVVDGSCFVSSGCVNPTLTILALAMRASEYLIEQYKRGDV